MLELQHGIGKGFPTVSLCLPVLSRLPTCTNIARRLFLPNVLFASLQSETIRLGSVRITA